MSEQDRPGPPDEEPLIGGQSADPPPSPGSPPPPPEGEGVIGVTPREPVRRSVDPWEAQRLRRDRADLRNYGRDGPRAGYYGATNRSAGRTIAIYFFTLVALAIGGVLIFLLFQVLNDEPEVLDDDFEPPPQVEAEASIEAPEPGATPPVGEDIPVIVRVVSGEEIVRFELLVSGIVTDQEFSGRVTGENTYAAVLTARFEAAGAYDLVVRAYTASGEQIVSEPIRVRATPPEVETPVVLITAEVVALTSLRVCPFEACNQAGTLEPTQVVTVIGKTLNQQWLQVETGGGLWVRFSAVDISPEDLASVPAVEPPPAPADTPTPPPTQVSGTETPTPTATGAAAPPPNAPDFIPTNAEPIEGGTILRITLTNASTNPFSGPIVVRVEGVPASPAEQVLTVSMEPNGTAALNFDLDPPITEQTTVTVTLDPDDAIAEANEDNNVTEFILVPPPEGPILSLRASVTGGMLSVVIQNDGGELTTNDARLVVSVPGETTTRTISPLAIAENDSATIDGISAPRTGESIRVTLFIDGINVATASVPNPNVVDVPPDGQDSGTQPTEGATIEPDEPQEPEEPEE
ncbi:MAG: hypothetical protein OXI51_12855 [Chloroflexota bacterium]|nr:hypothetical protein [Chloroflexota bacterium]